MTPIAPSWGDIEDFLRADEWRPQPDHGGGPRQRHIFWEKTLPEGRSLQTHVSHSSNKTVSPGRFSSILHNQLEVSRQEFWECIRTDTPVERPVERSEEAPAEHDPWVVDVLVRELGFTADEIEVLTPDEAQRLVHEHWSRPR